MVIQMQILIPFKNDEFQLPEIDGEQVLYNAGLPDVVYLNEASAMIWSLCDGIRSGQEVIEMIEGCYPDQITTIKNDVETIIGEFENIGAITSCRTWLKCARRRNFLGFSKIC